MQVTNEQEWPVVTKDDWAEWIDNPVTKWIFRDLSERRALYSAKLQAAVGDSLEEIGINAVQNKTRIAAYNDILDITYEEVVTEETSDEVAD